MKKARIVEAQERAEDRQEGKCDASDHSSILAAAQLDQGDLRRNAQAPGEEPVAGAGVYVELRLAPAIQTHVIGKKESGQRPAQRTESALPAMRMSAERERDVSLLRFRKRARLMGQQNREGCR